MNSSSWTIRSHWDYNNTNLRHHIHRIGIYCYFSKIHGKRFDIMVASKQFLPNICRMELLCDRCKIFKTAQKDFDFLTDEKKTGAFFLCSKGMLPRWSYCYHNRIYYRIRRKSREIHKFYRYILRFSYILQIYYGIYMLVVIISRW